MLACLPAFFASAAMQRLNLPLISLLPIGLHLTNTSFAVGCTFVAEKTTSSDSGASEFAKQHNLLLGLVRDLTFDSLHSL
jgi:hypothetical protein